MANRKAVPVKIDVKKLPSDQLTELAEAVLTALVNHSKMDPKLKASLIEIIKRVENAINPDIPETIPVPTVEHKGWFGKVLNYVLTIAGFVLPFILKGKGITLASKDYYVKPNVETA